MARRVWWREERGTSLMEVVITSSLLSGVVALFTGVLLSMQGILIKEVDRSVTNDQARLAVQQIDREVRSGNVLYDPSLETDLPNGIQPGMSLRIYTQSNAPTLGSRCVQWRIYNETLQSRSWQSDALGAPVLASVTAFRVVAEHVVNQTVSPTVTAFSTSNSNRTINISVVVQRSSASGRTVRVDSSVSGRNTIYNFPTSRCATIPAYT